jgi:hypothetical protein
MLVFRTVNIDIGEKVLTSVIGLLYSHIALHAYDHNALLKNRK